MALYEQYDYDANSGYLYRVQFTATGVPTTTVWQLTNMDQYQRITQASIGGTTSTWGFDVGTNLLSGISASGVQGYNYSFDGSTGNLGTRTNSLRSKTETFAYDAVNLDRLVSVTGPSALDISYTINKNGNIETKGDAGTYAYDNTPYAVSRITNGQNISNDEQIIDYYSFEKVKNITEGIKTADFDYNADRQRIRMVLKTNGTETKTRYYFGGSCEREVVAGVTTQYIWIGGDAYTAVAVAKKVGTGAWTVYNIFRDHLGSITHLKGSTTDEYSFDAWGRRRNATDWTYDLTGQPTLFADRGFTAHEYLEDFKLYNMNGRLYDPVVSRFLSPDPYVQDPSFTQNLNRYSYCLNNPLKYNDPNGEWIMWPLVWAGNWLFGGMDRWINQKQPFNQAFSPAKNPVVFSSNYSPSNTTRQNNYGFSHPQIDAQKAAKYEEKVARQLGDFVTSQSGAGYMNNLFKNLDVDLQGDWKLTFGVQAGGNIESIGGKYGLYANLCSITLLGNDGGKMVYPGSRLFGYSQINQGLSGGFIVGAGVSHTFDGSFEGGGSVNDNIAVHGLFTNKAGWGGTSYQYDTSTGKRTINIGLNPQIGLLLGFEGAFNLKISW